MKFYKKIIDIIGWLVATGVTFKSEHAVLFWLLGTTLAIIIFSIKYSKNIFSIHEFLFNFKKIPKLFSNPFKNDLFLSNADNYNYTTKYNIKTHFYYILALLILTSSDIRTLADIQLYMGKSLCKNDDLEYELEKTLTESKCIGFRGNNYLYVTPLGFIIIKVFNDHIEKYGKINCRSYRD